MWVASKWGHTPNTQQLQFEEGRCWLFSPKIAVRIPETKHLMMLPSLPVRQSNAPFYEMIFLLIIDTSSVYIEDFPATRG